MKILNLIQCANLGGMEQASLRLMGGLQARGHRCELLSLNPIGALGPLLNAAGIPHEGLPYAGKGGWRTMAELRRKLRGNDADALLMTGHHLLAMLALGDFCRGHRVLAIHFHHAGVKPDWQWWLIYRLACSRFQAITFPADFIRQEAERIHPPVAALAQTIRNPLTLPPPPTVEQKLAARRMLGLPPAVPVIGNAGWLIPRKRFDIFLRVATRVLRARPDAQFVIAGDGSERQSLERLAQELHIEHNVHWLGWQKNLETFYHAIDVLLFNSDWDALPTTPQEAMSHGIPVVASAENGGLAEVISSSEFGYIINRHDDSALAQEVIFLLNSLEARRTIGVAARTQIARLADPETIAKQYENLLLN